MDASFNAVASPRDLLIRLSAGWARRAEVKNGDLEDASSFDVGKDDFLEALLPFHRHPGFISAPEELKKKILTCGWLAYNQKTIAIETEIVTPVCNALLYDEVPGVAGPECKKIISETLVDEAYHTLLAVSTCNLTQLHRGFSVCIPRFNLTLNMHRMAAAQPDPLSKTLVNLAVAVVSELFISDYLKQLSSSTSIQPLHQLAVASHRKDELAHSKIFSLLMEKIYGSWSLSHKIFFARMLCHGARWFADSELDVWHSLLQQIGCPRTNEIIMDCKSSEAGKPNFINYVSLVTLVEDLGLLDIPEVHAAFAENGLLEQSLEYL